MEIKRVINPANQILLDRTSIRKYNPTVKISREEMSDILQDAMTAPSSLNLQPWRFVVIDSEEGKNLIKPYMLFNHQQWETSSAIIAVFGDLKNPATAEKIYHAAVDKGIMLEEYMEKMLEMIHSYTSAYTTDHMCNTVMLDCGFVTMQIMLAAKGYGYDTNPIGGFMKKELTEALGMDKERYFPVILISIGKAAEKAKDSIRYSASEITQWK